MAPAHDVWTTVLDSNTGRQYWWNQDTDDVSWDPPPFGSHSLEMAGNGPYDLNSSFSQSHFAGGGFLLQNEIPRKPSLGASLTDFFESFWEVDDRKARLFFFLIPICSLVLIFVMLVIGLSSEKWFEYCAVRGPNLIECTTFSINGNMKIERTLEHTGNVSVGTAYYNVWDDTADLIRCNGDSTLCLSMRERMSCQAMKARADLPKPPGSVWYDAWLWRHQALCPIARATLSFGILSVFCVFFDIVIVLVGFLIKNSWRKALCLLAGGASSIILTFFLLLDIIIYGGGSTGAFREEFALGIDVSWWLGPGYNLHIASFFFAFFGMLWQFPVGYYSMVYWREYRPSAVRVEASIVSGFSGFGNEGSVYL